LIRLGTGLIWTGDGNLVSLSLRLRSPNLSSSESGKKSELAFHCCSNLVNQLVRVFISIDTPSFSVHFDRGRQWAATLGRVTTCETLKTFIDRNFCGLSCGLRRSAAK
jgi:hypothetical protein